MRTSNPRKRISRKSTEHMLYIGILILLLLYGLLKDSEAADRLIKAITNAFSILIYNDTSKKLHFREHP